MVSENVKRKNIESPPYVFSAGNKTQLHKNASNALVTSFKNAFYKKYCRYMHTSGFSETKVK